MIVDDVDEKSDREPSSSAVPEGTSVDEAQREAARRKIVNRLKRLEGQVRGVQRMVEEDRSCHEILTLISSVRRALDAAGDEVLANYLNDCRAGLEEGSVETAAVLEAVKLARG